MFSNKLIDVLGQKKSGDLIFLKRWPNDASDIPVYHASSTYAFNRAVGCARFLNASAGTVLYRGQTKLYSSLSPSGARATGEAVTDKLLLELLGKEDLMKSFYLDRKEIKGWQQYQALMVESILQHYGAKTYCMDFVDNHWCALWFGLYEFKNDHYHKRKEKGTQYVILYLADTVGPCVQGMYIGADTYTVDLRRALPSTFQRPSSQHGWIVRNKERKKDPLDNQIIGIIEVDVSNAERWLGEGALLSEDNFFPCFTIDQGYKELLARQKRSGLPSRKEKVLPQNTICNYHYSELFFVSGKIDKLTPPNRLSFLKGKSGEDLLTNLYSKMLNQGWSKDTCIDAGHWDENNPASGQSAATALLIQDCFGGEIYGFKYSDYTHYYNLVDGATIDLVYSELRSFLTRDYYSLKAGKLIESSALARLNSNYKTKAALLLSNCTK